MGGCCRDCLDRVKATNKAACKGRYAVCERCGADAVIADAEFVPEHADRDACGTSAYTDECRRSTICPELGDKLADPARFIDVVILPDQERHSNAANSTSTNYQCFFVVYHGI